MILTNFTLDQVKCNAKEGADGLPDKKVEASLVGILPSSKPDV